MQIKSFIYLKAICAVIVVLSACGMSIGVTNGTHLFLPAIFMVLGYFFDPTYWTERHGYIYRKVKHIYFPFIVWASVFVILHNIFALINFTSDGIYGWQETFQRLWNICLGMQGYDPVLNAAFWIVRAMFVGAIGFYAISYLFKKILSNFTDTKIIECSILSIITLVIWMTLFDLNIPFLPYGGYTELTATMFFGLGCLYRQYESYLYQRKWIYALTTLVVIALAVLYPSSMFEKDFFAFLSLLFGGVSAFITLHYLSDLIAKYDNKVTLLVNYVGERWLYIVAFFPLFFKIVGVFHILCSDLKWEMLALFPSNSETFSAISIVYWIVGCTCPILCVWGWNKADAKYNLTPKNCLLYTINGIKILSKWIWKGICFIGSTIWKSIKSFCLNILDIVKASNPKDE